jgi:hypothetical protein
LVTGTTSGYFGISGPGANWGVAGSLNPTSLLTTYTGLTSNFLTANDMDGTAATPAENNATWTSFDIAGYTNLTFYGNFAEAPPLGYDNPDFVIVYASVDALPFRPLIALRVDALDADGLNGTLRVVGRCREGGENRMI